MRNARAIVAISFVLGAASFVTGCGGDDTTWSPPATSSPAPVQPDTAVQATAIETLGASDGTGLWCAVGGVCYSARGDARQLNRIGAHEHDFAGEVTMPGVTDFSIALGEGTIFLHTLDGVFMTSDGEGQWAKAAAAPGNDGAMALGADGRLYVSSGSTYGNAGETSPIFVSKQAWNTDAKFEVVGESCRGKVLSMAANKAHDLYAILQPAWGATEVYVMRNGNPLWEDVDTSIEPTRLGMSPSGKLVVFSDSMASACEIDAAGGELCTTRSDTVPGRAAGIVVDVSEHLYMAAMDLAGQWSIYTATFGSQWTKVVDLPSSLSTVSACTAVANDHVGDLLIRCGDTVYRTTP
jgi:hypothetical protein